MARRILRVRGEAKVCVQERVRAIPIRRPIITANPASRLMKVFRVQHSRRAVFPSRLDSTTAAETAPLIRATNWRKNGYAIQRSEILATTLRLQVVHHYLVLNARCRHDFPI